MNQKDKNTIVVSSVTHAQRAQRYLSNNGIYSTVFRSEAVKSVHGCGYAIRVSSNILSSALSILSSNNINVLGVI